MKTERQMLKVLAMVAAVTLLAQAGRSDVVNLVRTKSAYLREASADSNNGNKIYAYVGYDNNGDELKGLVAFDTSALDGINFEVTGITLYLRVYSPGAATTNVYAVDPSNDWVMNTCTWNTKDGTNGWVGSPGLSTAGTDYNAALLASQVVTEDDQGAWIAFNFDGVNTDLTALPGGWMTGSNAGLLLQEANDGLVSYYGRSYNPYLQVTYDVVPEPVTVAMLGLGGIMMLVRRRRQYA